MKVRLFLDEDVHTVLAVALRKRGHDTVNALEEGRLGLPDESQLTFADEINRCLVSFNVGDFVRLHNRWITESREHAGIIVSKQLPVGESLRRLLAFLQKETSESMKDQIRFL